MQEKPEESVGSEKPQEESGIFSRHKSADEIKAEEREKKARQKIERKAQQAADRRARKAAAGDENRTVLWVMLGILGAAVILAVVMLALQLKGDPKDPVGGDDQHFYDTAAQAEMSEEGIKGVITEAYYTRDKHLALVLNLSNGLPTKHYLTSLKVTVSNEDGGQIASGYTDQIKNDYYIEPNGYGTFTFYIRPEDIQIHDDDLDSLTYEITTTGRLEDPSVLSSTTGTASAE